MTEASKFPSLPAAESLRDRLVGPMRSCVESGELMGYAIVLWDGEQYVSHDYGLPAESGSALAMVGAVERMRLSMLIDMSAEGD